MTQKYDVVDGSYTFDLRTMMNKMNDNEDPCGVAYYWLSEVIEDFTFDKIIDKVTFFDSLLTIEGFLLDHSKDYD